MTLGPRRLDASYEPTPRIFWPHAGCCRCSSGSWRASFPGRQDGRFAMRTGLPDAMAAGLAPQEAALYDKIALEPQPLDVVLSSTAQRATLDRLVSRGLVLIAGFTPSDAMHVLGRQDQWNREAARLGAESLCPPQVGVRAGPSPKRPKCLPNRCQCGLPGRAPRRC